jgi:hypothetical protein
MQFRGDFLWWVFIPMLVFLGLFIWSAADKAILFRDYTKTTGEVIRLENRESTDGTISLDIRVRYQSRDGQSHETRSKIAQERPRESVGDIIPVWVSKAHPEQARIGTFVELWLGFTISVVIGGIFFLIWYGTWIGPPRKS